MSVANQICQKVIGKACFKAYPSFSRRAIAYRLLHLLIPSDIAKILPKKLSDPLIAPGVTIPLNAKFPPGTCIIPGCDFPAGWDPDQDPPECTKSAPLPPLAMQLSGGAGPAYLTPGPSGPIVTQPQTPIQNGGPWFYDGFDLADVDWTVWTDLSTGSGEAITEGGKLKLIAPGAVDYGRIRTAADDTIPSAFTLTMEVRHIGTTGVYFTRVETGAHYLGLEIKPPTTITIFESTGGVDYPVDSIVDETDIWKIVYTGVLQSIFRNDVPIVENKSVFVSTANKGRIQLQIERPGTVYVDDLEITGA